MTSFTDLIYKAMAYFDTNEIRAYKLYKQLYGVDSYYDEQYALELVKDGLPNAYKKIEIAGNLSISIEEIYNEAKEQNKSTLAKAIEDAGYLDVPANINSYDDAQSAIDKGFYTEAQLIRCNPKKVEALISRDAIFAIEEGLIYAQKLYQFETNKITSLTSNDAIAAMIEGIISFEKLASLEAEKIDELIASPAVQQAIEASSKIYFFSANGDLEAVKKALAENVSPNSDYYKSPLSAALLSRHPEVSHLLVLNGAHFNHADFAENDPHLISLIEEFLSKQEQKQVLAHFELASDDCSVVIQGFCLLKTTGDVATNESYNLLSHIE